MEQAVYYYSYHTMTVANLMKCLNHIMCPMCSTYWREGLHWYYNICITLNYDLNKYYERLVKIFMINFLLLTVVSSLPTPHMPVLRYCANIFS